MYNQLHENLTESETKYKPSTLVERLRDLNRHNKRTHVKCQCGCFIIRSVRVRPDYIDYNWITSIYNMFVSKYINGYVLINDNTNNCNYTQSDLDEIVKRKTQNYFHIIIMIQHKKYDNETTDDMIKNENKKYKKSSYEEIRELVMEKEKGNNPVEDKIKKKKMKIFKNNNSNQKDYTKLFNL